jgi:hypothetical protein
LASNPAAAKVSTKHCMTSGRIMSAPLPATRQRDRSNRSATSIWLDTRRAQMS